MDILSSKLPVNNAIYKDSGKKKKKKKYLQHIYVYIPTSHKQISWEFFLMIILYTVF